MAGIILVIVHFQGANQKNFIPFLLSGSFKPKITCKNGNSKQVRTNFLQLKCHLLHFFLKDTSLSRTLCIGQWSAVFGDGGGELLVFGLPHVWFLWIVSKQYKMGNNKYLSFPQQSNCF